MTLKNFIQKDVKMDFENLDRHIINEREKKYKEYRQQTFLKMCKKHSKKECNCKKNNK